MYLNTLAPPESWIKSHVVRNGRKASGENLITLFSFSFFFDFFSCGGKPG